MSSLFAVEIRNFSMGSLERSHQNKSPLNLAFPVYGHEIVFMGKTLHSHIASLSIQVFEWVPGNLNSRKPEKVLKMGEGRGDRGNLL